MTQNEILGALQEVALGRAETLDRRAAKLQMVVLSFSVAGVLVTHPIAIYGIAMTGVLVILAWLWTWKLYLKYRHLGEQARRARLLADGLRIPLDGRDLRDLIERANVVLPQLEKYLRPEFFASKLEPGDERLAELIEESAFWSSRLYGLCAHKTKLVFGAALLISIGILALSLPFVNPHAAIKEFRVLFILFAFLISGEVLVRAWAYEIAEAEVRRIEHLLRGALLVAGGRERLLYLMGDYNAAVELAPLMLTGMFQKHQDRLNKLWDERNRSGRPPAATAG